MAKVELKGIGKVYDGGVRAVNNANITIEDKEFRYLRTVIVTAAVYWGFDSMLHLTNDIPS